MRLLGWRVGRRIISRQRLQGQRLQGQRIQGQRIQGQRLQGQRLQGEGERLQGQRIHEQQNHRLRIQQKRISGQPLHLRQIQKTVSPKAHARPRLLPSRALSSFGFTLIEVLIATSILAGMGAMTYGSVKQAYQQKQEIEAAQERDAQVRAALDLMVHEISHAFLSDHYDRKRYRERPTFFKGEDRGRRDELNFTSLAHERLELDSKVSDQAAIRYWVDRDPDSRSDEALFRRVNPVIDEEAERKGNSAVLCEGVRGFELEYWDGRKQEWVKEWDAAKPERLGVLPSRVRITLTVADENGKDRVFSTQTRIAIRRALRFY